MVGVDPLGHSLRELVQMLEGQRKEQWSKVSHLLAMLHNAWAKEPKSPDEFNPTRLRVPGVSASFISDLKNAWLGG